MTEDLSLPAQHALKTLSRAMTLALLGAHGRQDGLALDCQVTCGTSVALIRRHLVVAGSVHYLTALGCEVRTLLRAQSKERARKDRAPAIARGSQPAACVLCGHPIISERGEPCEVHKPGPLQGVTKAIRIRLSVIVNPDALHRTGDQEVVRALAAAGLATRVDSTGFRLTERGFQAWRAVWQGDLPDALKFALLKPTTALSMGQVRDLTQRGLMTRDMGGKGLPVQTEKGRERVREILDELGLTYPAQA